jgi:hypothetical protein
MTQRRSARRQYGPEATRRPEPGLATGCLERHRAQGSIPDAAVRNIVGLIVAGLAPEKGSQP